MVKHPPQIDHTLSVNDTGMTQCDANSIVDGERPATTHALTFDSWKQGGSKKYKRTNELANNSQKCTS
jgi:hypothetical protein